jgi:GrpB-like predicted nucleotidyltransferase (UPF0157 family)
MFLRPFRLFLCGIHRPDEILRWRAVGGEEIPILDILVEIDDFAAGRDLVPLLAGLGYEYRPDEEIPDRHYFRRRRGTIRTHHLSLAEPASHHYRVTIGFRDALRLDPGLASRYGALKADLAERFPHDRASYTAGKSPFVEAC